MARPGTSGIDSEIALTALLATSVLALPIPSSGLYPFFKVVAFGLLFLTLLRRMAAIQGYSADSLTIMATTYILDPATYISLLYVVFVSLQKASILIGANGLDPLLFGILAPMVVFLGFLIWELAFRAGLTEGERTFEAVAKRHQGELIGLLLSRMSSFAQSERVYGEEYTKQTELSSFHESNRELEDLSPDEMRLVFRNIGVTLLALGISIGGYLLLLPISHYGFSGRWLPSGLLLLTTVMTSGFVRLWYSNYGLVKVEERNGFLTFAGDAITYLLFSWFLFS